MAKDPVARYLLHRTSRLERSARLRPMETTEIMDLAMRVYQNFGLVMLRATAAPALFCFASIAFLTQYVFPALFETEHVDSVAGQVGEALSGLGLAFAVGGPLFLIGLSYASVATVHLVSDFIGGRAPNEANAHSAARKFLAPMFRLYLRDLVQAWAGVLASFLILVVSALMSQVMPANSLWPGVVSVLAIFGFVVGFLIMPWLIGRTALGPAVLCLEGPNPKDAARRSVELMKGTPYTPSGYGTILLLVFVELVLLLLIWIGAQSSIGLFNGFEIARSLADWPWVGVVLDKALGMTPFFLAVWIIIPVWTTTVTLLYFERRIRLEGYDVLALAQEVWRTDRQSRFEL